jgi:hypothetical protein
MVKKIVYCDRCGKEVQYPIIAKARLYGGKKMTRLELTEDERIDLCQSCIDSLAEWLHENNKI